MSNSNNLPTLPSEDEILAQVYASEFLKEDEWWDVEVDEDVLDVTQDYPISYTLSINGTPFAPLGGIHGMTGQPGSGKTMTLSMVAAAVLGDTKHGMEWLLTDEIPKPKVLYIDTEMERGNTMLVNKRICSMLGWDWHTPHAELTIMCLREVVTAAERWKKVLKGIYKFQPTVVILDGVIDVVSDFNDNQDCQQLIFKCMAAASHYNISFWCLLHQNPGSEKMVGHAGSFLERKASDVMVTKKDKDNITGEVTFELKNKKVRGKDWQSFLFRVNDEKLKFGVPELVEKAEVIDPEEAELHKLDEWMKQACPNPKSCSKTEVRDNVKAQQKVGSTKAMKAVNDALSAGILEVAINNKLIYRGLNSMQENAEQNTLPF